MARNFIHHNIQQVTDEIMHGEQYCTVVGYANLIGVKIDRTRASQVGKMASKICRENGWDIGTVLHPMFGKCNTYPVESLDKAFHIKSWSEE